VVIHEAPAVASAPNPDESPPTDPGANAAAPPPSTTPVKRKKPKPPPVVAAPDAEPAAPFQPAPDPPVTVTGGNARGR
jgi:hypothetical protein